MASDPRQPTVADATFAPFRLTLRVSASLVLLWLVSISAQIAYIHLHKLDGVAHIERQISYYTDTADSTGLANRMATVTYEWAFERLRLHVILGPAAQGTPKDTAVTPYLKRSLWVAYKPELLISAYASVLYAAKIGVFVTIMPLLLIWLLAFGVDGLVQRSIRKACGGHESAALYHRAKLYGVRLLPPFAAVIFLCSPIAISPGWVFVPVALVSALLLRLQAAYYKKYL